MPSVVGVDPVAEVIAALVDHPTVDAALGGAGRVSGVVEDPFPHLVVTLGPVGELGDLRGRLAHDVRLELYGPLTGTIAGAGLWQALTEVLEVCVGLSEREHPPGRAVIASVRPAGGILDQPLANGQRRATATVRVVLGPVQ